MLDEIIALAMQMIVRLFPAESRDFLGKVLRLLRRIGRAVFRRRAPVLPQPAPPAPRQLPGADLSLSLRPRRSGWVNDYKYSPGGGMRITVLGGDPRTEAWARRVFGGW